MSNLKFKKHRLKQKYSATLEEKYQCSTEKTPQLLTQILSLLPVKQKNCLNFKGGESARPGTNELLLIKGHIFESDTKKIKRNFEICHETPFKEFRGKSDIVFSLKKQLVGIERDELPIELLPKLFPIEITHLRFELDLYYPKKYFFFGYHPDVAESIFIEWKDQKMVLRIKASLLEEKWEPPLRDKELRDKVTTLLSLASSST